MELLNSTPIIDLSGINYRIKICVNFDGESYSDSITDVYLLGKINQFIKYGFMVKYANFQKSNICNEYGIIISKNKRDDCEMIYNQLKSDCELKVFGYYNEGGVVEYLSTDARIRNKYYDFDWWVSINGFVQPTQSVGKLIHEIVDQMIIKGDENTFYGIGGESCMYSHRGNFKKSICLTNSRVIYDDCIFNKGHENIYLINYEKDQLNKYIDCRNDSIDKKILLINISRNGLKNLAHQIININITFDQIIYIGCCDKGVSNDIKILSKMYEIKEIKKLKQFTGADYNSYVIHFTK